MHRQQVGQHLRRVEIIGQSVVHRHTRELRQRFRVGLREPPVFNAIIEPTQHPGGVFHGFLVPDMAARGANIRHMRALIIGRHFKAGAGASAVFLEDQGDILAAQAGLFGARCLRFFQRQVLFTIALYSLQKEIMEDMPVFYQLNHAEFLPVTTLLKNFQ